MSPFTYETAADLPSAAKAIQPDPAMALAGGTTMLDLMKLGIYEPETLVSIDAATSDEIEPMGGFVRIGSGCRMSDAAEHEAVAKGMPAIAESLLLAASPQLRNMASMGGNLLQRTRCPYFRDTSFEACNKRDPGSGCMAIDDAADNRMLAVLGTSDACIAHYPGDFAAAAVALGASVNLVGPDGERTIPVAELHALPGDTPEVETTLRSGELIASIDVPTGPAAANSVYYKVRDRASYAFALVSVAAGLELDGDTVKTCKLALGGVGTVPWDCAEAAADMTGKPATRETFQAAAESIFRDAVGYSHNAFKIPMGKRAVVNALEMLADGTPRDQNLWHMQHGR